MRSNTAHQVQAGRIKLGGGALPVVSYAKRLRNRVIAKRASDLWNVSSVVVRSATVDGGGIRLSARHTERIMESYRAAKDAQRAAATAYHPAEHWQLNIDRGFAALSGSIREDSREDVEAYLANFRQYDLGIEWEAHLDFGKREVRKDYVKLLTQLYQLWRLQNAGEPLTYLCRPESGNPKATYELSGKPVTAGSFTMNYYTSQQRRLIEGLERPVIGEIGGGYGKMAYYLVRDMPAFCYLDFDLPETLALITYYLFSCFPERRFLLYGEGDLSESALSKYDFILLPNFCIDALPDLSCDLFVNKNSLGEMNKETVETYLRHVDRTCRGHFWHTNHELVPCTMSVDPGLRSSQFALDPKHFELLYRTVDFPSFLMHKGQADIVTYCYRRTRL